VKEILMRDWKLGCVFRCDNGGLGIEAMEFYRNLQPDKVLCVMSAYQNYPERFPGAMKTDMMPSDGTIADFLHGLDSVFLIEHPYNWNLFPMARERGIRAVMKVNYEYLIQTTSPDVYVFPNFWHAEGRCVIPLPLDLDRFAFRERRKAKIFLHVIGHNTPCDRNGTILFRDAIQLVKSDVRFLVACQKPFWQTAFQIFSDRRVEYLGEVLSNEELYRSADVLVMPRRFGGQSLVMEEAAACGMPMILSAMMPHWMMFMQAGLFVPISYMETLKLEQNVEYGTMRPEDIADAIDQMAGLDEETVAGMSQAARASVADRSWQPWHQIIAPLKVKTP
jgi:glycosyltransferase involved in cell wall biosynthesis